MATSLKLIVTNFYKTGDNAPLLCFNYIDWTLLEACVQAKVKTYRMICVEFRD